MDAAAAAPPDAAAAAPMDAAAAAPADAAAAPADAAATPTNAAAAGPDAAVTAAIRTAATTASVGAVPASIVSAEAALNLLRPVVRNSDTLHRKVLDQVLRSCRRLKAYAHHDAACGHTVKAAEAAAGDVAKAQQALQQARLALAPPAAQPVSSIVSSLQSWAEQWSAAKTRVNDAGQALTAARTAAVIARSTASRQQQLQHLQASAVAAGQQQQEGAAQLHELDAEQQARLLDCSAHLDRAAALADQARQTLDAARQSSFCRALQAPLAPHAAAAEQAPTDAINAAHVRCQRAQQHLALL